MLMDTESRFDGADPRQLLSAAHDVALGVRRAQRATWFPLLVLAAVTLGAIPVERYGGRAMVCSAALGPGVTARACYVYSTAGLVYLPIALVAAYGAIAAFYVRRSQAFGVGTRIRPYVIAGIVIAALSAGASLWLAHHPPSVQYDIFGPSSTLLLRVASASGAMGFALLVLARVERNWSLVLFTLAYLAVMLLQPAHYGSLAATHPSPWFRPQLEINGCVLALGGIGFALAERLAPRPRHE